MAGQITELRLSAFKSYHQAVIPLAPLAVLIGRNGSGKSNALDALEMLSRLAKGEEIRDASRATGAMPRPSAAASRAPRPTGPTPSPSASPCSLPPGPQSLST